MIDRLPRIFDPTEQRPAKALALVIHGVAAQRHEVLGSLLDVVVPLMFIILIAGGLVGLAILKDDPNRRRLVLITVLYFILLYAPTIMKARYFLPMVCLLSIYAARLIVTGLRKTLNFKT
jgi:hypothetical protein